MELLARLIDVYSLIVLAGVIMSWVGVSYGNPLAEFVHSMTEPLLTPIRRFLPPAGGLDFSPMVLLIALHLVRRAISSL